ncbi:hypothetical protein R1sor_007377 [Riccia sorocarpa]|uniref:RING-type domain-containing protein n=1 Tax=Riccia sorocarpa TaxID=122646 RepID=A0ABD3HSH0_9MARC
MVEESSLRAKGVGEICSICLEPISGEGFLDQCFHKFCYHCILQWSEMVLSRPSGSNSKFQYLECPLCKTQYTSIIHDISGTRFQRHYVLTSTTRGFVRDPSWLLKLEAHLRRQAVYSVTCVGPAPPKPAKLSDAVSKPNRWVSCWVQRELQALMQEEDVDTVTHHVVGIVESFSKRSRGKVSLSRKQGAKIDESSWHETVAAAVRPFVFEYAERFAVELESFLASGLDIAAYDQKYELARQPAPNSDRAIVPSQVKDFRPTYDLYDEDVDEDFDRGFVRKERTGSEGISGEENSETMKQRTRHEDGDLREGTTSRKEAKGKESITDPVTEGVRGRSKHRSESKLKKRKRSLSGSSRSRSPSKHKRRKREKNHKKRKHSKRKDRKAAEEPKRKSHKSRSRSRRRNYRSSDSSAEGESSRSSRSRSPVDRRSKRKAGKKDRSFAEKPASQNPRSRNKSVSKRDDKDRRPEEGSQRKSHRHSSPSGILKPEDKNQRRPDQRRSLISSSPSGIREREDEDQRTRQQRSTRSHYSSSPSEAERPYESSREDFGDPNHSERGKQGSAREDTQETNAAQRSSPRAPQAGFTPSHPSTSASPRAPAERYSWDARDSSRSPSPQANDNEEPLRRVPRSEVSVQMSDVVEENANTLELKLREQALANLMKHLSQPRHARESTAAGNIQEKSEVPNQSKVNNVSSGSKGMELQPPFRSKSPESRDQEDVKEVQENKTHGTGNSERLRLADGKVIAEGGLFGESAAVLEGRRQIVVELVVDNEPFDCSISYRGSKPSLVTDDRIGERKEKLSPEHGRHLNKGSCVEKDHQHAGREKTVQQESHPEGGSSEVQDFLESRQEKLSGKEDSSVARVECGEREESTLSKDRSPPKTGELGPDAETVERSGREESANIRSTAKDTKLYSNGTSRLAASEKGRQKGDEGGGSARFQQKSMSVTRGGESIEVSYKVYIPQRPAGARRRLQR